MKQLGLLLIILALHTVGVSLSMQQPKPWRSKSYGKILKKVGIDGVREFVNQGWDVNERDIDGDSVLTHALGYARTFKYLIENGANIHQKTDKRYGRYNHEGETFLHQAAESAYSDTVLILIQAGADVNALTKKGETPLFYACNGMYEDENHDEDRIKTVQRLLAHSADVNKRPDCGSSVLHKLTGEWGRGVKVTELLLAYGADVGLVDNKGKTCLSYAVGRVYGLYMKYSLAHSNVDLKKMEEDIGRGFLITLEGGMQSLMNNTASKMRASYFLRDTLTELCLIREHGGDSVFGKDFLPLDMFKLILKETKDQSQSTKVSLRPSARRIQEIITFFKDEGFDQRDPGFMQQLEEYKNKQ
ncbi:MAG: ankyrin repeat domain-containing protein [Candidatus Babeliales bacterium]